MNLNNMELYEWSRIGKQILHLSYFLFRWSLSRSLSSFFCSFSGCGCVWVCMRVRACVKKWIWDYHLALITLNFLCKTYGLCRWLFNILQFLYRHRPVMLRWIKALHFFHSYIIFYRQISFRGYVLCWRDI